jgi:hypothetical protein
VHETLPNIASDRESKEIRKQGKKSDTLNRCSNSGVEPDSQSISITRIGVQTAIHRDFILLRFCRVLLRMLEEPTITYSELNFEPCQLENDGSILSRFANGTDSCPWRHYAQQLAIGLDKILPQAAPSG